MANGNPYTTIDLPPEWPVGSGDVTQTNGVLTTAGEEWVQAELQKPMYKDKFDPSENPVVVTNGTQITFKNVAGTAEKTEAWKRTWQTEWKTPQEAREAARLVYGSKQIDAGGQYGVWDDSAFTIIDTGKASFTFISSKEKTPPGAKRLDLTTDTEGNTVALYTEIVDGEIKTTKRVVFPAAETPGDFQTFWQSEKEAISAARIAYGEDTSLDIDFRDAPRWAVINVPGRGFTHIDKKDATPAGAERLEVSIDREGNTVAKSIKIVDGKVVTGPPKIIFTADEKPETWETVWKDPELAKAAAIEAYGPSPIGPDGEPIHPWKVIKVAEGFVFIDKPEEEDDDTRTPGAAMGGDTRDIDLGPEKGDLLYLGDGKYEHVPDIEAPFAYNAGNIVKLDALGGSLIKTSKNQYQFIRDTYQSDDPNRKVDETGREYLRQIDGSWKELGPRAKPGVVPFGDETVDYGKREFLQQPTGGLTELDPRFDVGLQTADGMSLLQQRGGGVSQLTPPNLDQIITQALVDGEYDKAFAFQDFRDRPSAAETFQTALSFARSPADQVLISSIARGEQTVQPPPPGTIQRVGPQADFLVQAYQDFQSRTQAGRTPTPEEAQALTDRALAGRTPQLDTLQMRMEHAEEIHQANLQEIRNKGERDNATWQQLFTQKEEKYNRDAADAEEERKRKKSAEFPGEDPLLVEDPLPGGDPLSTSPGNLGTQMPVAAGEEDEEYGEQLTDLHRERLVTERTQQGLGLGLSAERAAEIARSTPSGVPYMQHAAMSLQESLGDTQRNALNIIAKGSGGVEAQLANLAGLSSALTADPSAVLTQAGSASPTGGVGSLKFRAGGGIVGNREVTVVGEQGPEIAMMPTGTRILPLGRASQRDIRAAQSTGRAYAAGGTINFGELPFGLRQIQAGRPITPSRGYLSRAAGLTLPSAQALSNITPESRDVYFDLAAQAGIPSRAFGQELQTAIPRGTRLPTSRMLPLGRRGVR